MTERKRGPRRRRHDCGPFPGVRAGYEAQECVWRLEMGPGPQAVRDHFGDVRGWGEYSGEELLAAAFGSLEAAAAAWAAHKAELGALARAVLARAEREGRGDDPREGAPPLAHGVFEPDAPWPPPDSAGPLTQGGAAR